MPNIRLLLLPKQKLLLRLLPKIGVGTSLIIGAASALYDPWTLSAQKIEYKTPNKLPEIKTVKNFDDIELLEKVNRCSIAFVNRWNQNKTYKVKEFFSNLSKEQKRKQRKKIIKAVNKELKKCKPGSVITLSYKKFEDIFLEKFEKHKPPKVKVIVTVKKDKSGKKVVSKKRFVRTGRTEQKGVKWNNF